jgi:hypothetical protein
MPEVFCCRKKYEAARNRIVIASLAYNIGLLKISMKTGEGSGNGNVKKSNTDCPLNQKYAVACKKYTKTTAEKNTNTSRKFVERMRSSINKQNRIRITAGIYIIMMQASSNPTLKIPASICVLLYMLNTRYNSQMSRKFKMRSGKKEIISGNRKQSK